MDYGVQCATIVSTIMKLELYADNLDIPLQTQKPTVVLTTEQEAGQSGWTMLVVLALNPICLIVIITAGELPTVNIVKMSEFLVVSPFPIFVLLINRSLSVIVVTSND